MPKIAHSAEDSLTTVAWSSDGRKIACGGTRGQFYQCDSKGTVLEQKEGVRVQAMAYGQVSALHFRMMSLLPLL